MRGQQELTLIANGTSVNRESISQSVKCGKGNPWMAIIIRSAYKLPGGGGGVEEHC